MTLANDGAIKWHRHNVTAVRGDKVANRWSTRNPHDQKRYNAIASFPTLLPFFHNIHLNTLSVTHTHSLSLSLTLSLSLPPIPQTFLNISRNISKPYEYLLGSGVCNNEVLSTHPVSSKGRWTHFQIIFPQQNKTRLPTLEQTTTVYIHQ